MSLIPIYAAAVAKKKSKGKPGEALIRTIAISLGPAIHRDDATLIAAGDPKEIERVKTNFLIKRLSLPDGPAPDKAIDDVLDLVGRATKNTYRGVAYHPLVKLLRN